MRRALLTLALLACACQPQPAAPATDRLPTPAWGPRTAPVELLAFVDLECPHSRAQAAVLDALHQAFPDDLRIRVLYLPLDLYPNSVLGAMAAVAAERQGKFDAFWRFWMQPGKALSREALLAWAVDHGLDAQRFAADLIAPETRTRVARDVAIAAALGVRATPTLLLDGEVLVGGHSLADLRQRVEAERADVGMLRAAGAPQERWLPARIARRAPQLAEPYARYVQRAEPAPAQTLPLHAAEAVSPASANTAGGAGGQPGTAGHMDAALHSVAVDPAFGGGRALLLPSAATDAAGQAPRWRVSVRADDPQSGPADAATTLVVFLDPASADLAAVPWLTQLAGTPAAGTRVVFKWTPRPVHPHAAVTALALEAAREQGQALAFLQQLETLAQPWNEQALFDLAKRLHLDSAQVQTSLAARSGQLRIDADLAQADALGHAGFLAVYANGIRVEPPTPEAVARALTAARSHWQSLPAAERNYDAIVSHGTIMESLAPASVELRPQSGAIRGLPGAAVKLVLVGDLQCPYTARVWPHLQRLEALFPGRLQVAWLDFPRAEAHPLAQALAELGQAARRQGRFFALAEALARRVDALDEAGMWQAVREAGLAEAPLRKALKQHTWTAAVLAERAQAEQAGVRATPALFLNGHAFQPTRGLSADTLRPAIARLLADH